MKKIFSVMLLVLLLNCSTTNTSKDENKTSINNIVDVFKNIKMPTF